MNGFKIYTKKLAVLLRQQGFKIIGTDVDYKKPQFDIYIFEDTPELREYVSKYKK